MISIVLPTYNNLTLFKQALQGIRIQKDVRYELIVVDDSSNNEIENYVSGKKNIKYYLLALLFLQHVRSCFC